MEVEMIQILVHLSLQFCVKTKRNTNFQQYFKPTQDYGAPCSTLSHTDFMNKCQYSAAFELLNFIYGGSLIEPSSSNKAIGKVMMNREFDL
ncbi:hypothetical protein KUTeg_015065 [Tegillarca granosa]|uniref:Uncharacterized protein n=1 Tax=Tegillarca granosa TaxID=220873 RepID=A0ABQ9EP10_TEGGR|nr:hypothetical protein KUTeg_015065 [Tegillarca granosa]